MKKVYNSLGQVAEDIAHEFSIISNTYRNDVANDAHMTQAIYAYNQALKRFDHGSKLWVDIKVHHDDCFIAQVHFGLKMITVVVFRDNMRIVCHINKGEE